ncbi:MAG: NADH-ubiquinone oxidoreductase-F iron-sulfur binding region domain-containing protein [Patescibacteria group bacterium]|jgi:NADH:ubiquinone oxidoreductase subunit F (NADH-binding)
MEKNILQKIKKAGLIGRGGACFPVWEKWSAVYNELLKKPVKERKCYVICNASEGEPDVKKDRHILKKFPETVLKGMMAAVDFLGARQGYIYLNSQYYREIAPRLEKIIGDYAIEVLEKPHKAGYIGGEESAILNAIEGKKIEPRLKPPFPFSKGLFGQPTLTNNVETFYNVGRLLLASYEPNRFITITEHFPKSYLGTVIRLKNFVKKEVFLFPEDWSVKKILKASGRWPLYKFFVQVGGGASGIILNSNQLNSPVQGSGSISIFSLERHDPIELIRGWANFFQMESCGKCTPCREGTYRLKLELQNENPNWEIARELLDNLSEASFCGLGCAAPIAITGYFKNVFPLISGKDSGFSGEQVKAVCECFSE